MNIVTSEAVKRQKIEYSTTTPKERFNQGLLEFASNYLTFQDLINVEQISKYHKKSIPFSWKVISIRDGYMADWHDAEGTLCKEKNNYILSYFFAKLLQHLPIVQSLDSALQIDKEFGKLKQFSNFSTVVKIVVGKTRDFTFICSSEICNSLIQISNIAFEGAKKGKWSGDLWLQGIINLLNPAEIGSDLTYINISAQEYIALAIKQTGLIQKTEQIFINLFPDNLIYEELYSALASQKIFTYLDRVITEPYFTLEVLQEMKKKQGDLPPILNAIATLMIESGWDNFDHDYVEKLLDDAFMGYGVSAPESLFINTTLIKIKGKKYKEAQYFCEIISEDSPLLSLFQGILSITNKDYKNVKSLLDKYFQSFEHLKNKLIYALILVEDDLEILKCMINIFGKFLEPKFLHSTGNELKSQGKFYLAFFVLKEWYQIVKINSGLTDQVNDTNVFLNQFSEEFGVQSCLSY